MPRHQNYEKKTGLSNFLYYDSILIQKLANQLIKKGKKIQAYKLINQVIQNIERKTKDDPIQIIEQAIRNVTPAVEIKARRIGGAVYSIPIELSSERGISIAIRWIIKCSYNKADSSFSSNLSNEIVDASKKIGAAIRKKDEIHKIAESSTKLV